MGASGSLYYKNEIINENKKEDKKEEKNNNKEKKSMKFYPEQITKAKPIPLSNMKRYLQKEDATCKLITGKGTGFFCELQLQDYKLKVLLTCNHVLNEDLIKNNSKIKIKYKNTIKEITINELRFVCTNELLDYTCIQILFNDNINDYFQIDSNINNNNPNEIYNNELFAIYQCPEESDVSLIEGKIEDFKSNGVILHNISTDFGSSGGPLILSNNLNIVGIHRGKLNNELNQAIFIKNVLDDIKQKLSQKKKIKINPIGIYLSERKIYNKYLWEQLKENNNK